MGATKYIVIIFTITCVVACLSSAGLYFAQKASVNVDMESLEGRLTRHLADEIESVETAKLLTAEEEEKAKKAKYATQIAAEQKTQAGLQADIELIPWKVEFYKYSLIASLSVGLLCAIILSTYYGHSRLRRSSLVTQRTGKHSAVVMHYSMTKIPAVIMMFQQLAEIEKARAQDSERSMEMLRDWMGYSVKCVAALNRRGISGTLPGMLPAAEQLVLPVHIPSFSELLHTGEIAPGKPLILGFSQDGKPQMRQPEDIKSMAIGGWQGSGKTLSTAYIITSILYQYPTARVYVIDPHRNHKESLTALIKPLESCKRLKLINPADTHKLLSFFFNLLDNRLEGKEPSDPPVFLVIDEMAKLAKSLSGEHFDKFIAFLEAATEETRKTNITFFGISQKWDSRNFKNRKDIRASMPSLLVHKTKPSQADLLLEDSQEKKMVKALKKPGECLLATSHDADPQVVCMPLLQREDVWTVVKLIGNGQAIDVSLGPGNGKGIDTQSCDLNPQVNVEREKPIELVDKGNENELFLQKIEEYKAAQQLSLGELSRQSDVDKGLLSKVLNRKAPLTDGVKKKLGNLLTTDIQQNSTSGNKIINYEQIRKRKDEGKPTRRS